MARAVALALLLLVARPSTAAAYCVGPAIVVDPAIAATGERVEITGERFGTDCNDTGGSGPALGAPADDIELSFEQGDRHVPIAEVDADADYRFLVRATVPSDLVPGPAVVRAGSATVAITVLAREAPVEDPEPVIVEQGEPRSRNVVWVVLGLVVPAALLAIARIRRR